MLSFADLHRIPLSASGQGKEHAKPQSRDLRAHLDEVRDVASFANGALGTKALAEAITRAKAAAHFMMLVGVEWRVGSCVRQEGSNNHVMGDRMKAEREEGDESDERFLQTEFPESTGKSSDFAVDPCLILRSLVILRTNSLISDHDEVYLGGSFQ